MIKIMLLSMIYAGSLFTGIYDFSIPKANGGTQNLSAYANKRIVIVTLPVIQNAAADSLLYALDTIANAHASTHAIIAIPCFEDGYTVQNSATLNQWYRSRLGSKVLLTAGVYAGKTSGVNQHDLFKWLTSVSENGLFDRDITGPGQRFFINENGKLYGILDNPASMWGTTMYNTLTIKMDQE